MRDIYHDIKNIIFRLYIAIGVFVLIGIIPLHEFTKLDFGEKIIFTIGYIFLWLPIMISKFVVNILQAM